MKFIADGMLGGLAKRLRLLGFDTLCSSTSRKNALLDTARREGRLILTRDTKFAHENPDMTVFIENDGTIRQIQEVSRKLSLRMPPSSLFTRCSLCNCLLENREKTAVKDRIPEHVYNSRNNFRQCPSCKRVYWDGDHCASIRQTLSSS